MSDGRPKWATQAERNALTMSVNIVVDRESTSGHLVVQSNMIKCVKPFKGFSGSTKSTSTSKHHVQTGPKGNDQS